MSILKWKVNKTILNTGDYKLNNHVASKVAKKDLKKLLNITLT
jgi:hypothetical protein